MFAVIVDTNVVVAGLITSSPDSPVARILDQMLSGGLCYLLSPALLDEYRAVLLRPRLVARHGLEASDIDILLTEIVANAAWREPETVADAPDPGDNHLWALLREHTNSLLITGDRLLLDNPPESFRVLTPAHYLTMADMP